MPQRGVVKAQTGGQNNGGPQMSDFRQTLAEMRRPSLLMRAARLGLPGGQLVANPIPPEAELSRTEIMPHIETALAEAEAKGIAAKAVTPYLLSRIFELTAGRSLTANIALVLNNARLGAAIARELAAQG